MKAAGASYEEHEAKASDTGRRGRKGVVYKAIHGLSPTVELNMIWRHDGPGADLNSFLRVARESFKDKDVTSSSWEQAVSRVPNETSRVPNYRP